MRIIILLILGLSLFAQDELMEIIEEETPDIALPEIATFKSTRIVNSHSVKIPHKNELIFIISHRFGPANTGLYNFFGLDQALIRLGLEYTLPIDFINIGIGRSSYKKTYDGFIKIRILQQTPGKIPITLVILSTTSITTLKWDNDANYIFTDRMNYSHQILIAKKINKMVSLQISPTLIHRNLVPEKSHTNDIFSLGLGGRIKIAPRVTIVAEYFPFLTPNDKIPTISGFKAVPPVGVGANIETGGHVFQLFFTNAQASFNTGFLSETTEKFSNAGIFFGFNITRSFSF